MTAGALHHVEIWVPNLERAARSWGWVLGALGYTPFQQWQHGRSWRLGHTYLVLEESPDLTGTEYQRCRPGLNHLAFHTADRAQVDGLAREGDHNGWTLLFPDKHPYAGGDTHYAAYMENEDGYEIELVAPH